MHEPSDSIVGITPRPSDMKSPGAGALRDIIEHVYEEFPKYLGFHRVSLMLYDETNDSLISDDLIGLRARPDEGKSQAQKIGFSISGKCFAEERIINIDDCSKSNLVPQRFVKSLSLKSVVAVPVQVRGRTIGVLRVDDTERTHRFQPEDVEFLKMLAGMLGMIAMNPRLFRELREAEDQVRESEKNFRAVASNANDGILIVDSSGEVVYANNRMAEITQRDKDKLVGANLGGFINPALLERHGATFAKILAAEVRSTRQHESTITRPDGSNVPVELTITRTDWKSKPCLMAIFRDITVRRRLEKEVLEASETMQRRFGNDVHDGLGQTIAATALKCKILEQAISKQAPELIEEVTQLAKLIEHAGEESHRLAKGLSPVDIDSRGLVLALIDLISNLNDATAAACHFNDLSDLASVEAESANPPHLIYDQTVATQLYRIAQEATNNALKHGDATMVAVTLEEVNDGLLLEIEDDGKGFDSSQSREGSMGLRIMSHRARAIHAEFEIQSTPGGGTRVRTFLPYGD